MSTNARVPASEVVPESELGDLELLSQALREAEDAYAAGVIGGPGVDEVALRRAERRAQRADIARLVRSRVSDGGEVA